MAYGHILRSDILAVPPLGIYNFHGSILPKYRGASPIEAAIASGDRQTGVSLMRVVEKMDAGAVADVGTVPIGEDDTYAEVAEKIAQICPLLLQKNLEAICQGKLRFQEQDHGNATFTRKLSADDGPLDFFQPAMCLRNRVRAITPHIGARIDCDGVPLRIGRVSALAEDCAHALPGEVIRVGKRGLFVATGDGVLAIHELQRPTGRMLRVGDFINGFAIEPGKIFVSHPSQPFSSAQPMVKK
jgi:methionyl-tRNA formyltransferase